MQFSEGQLTVEVEGNQDLVASPWLCHVKTLQIGVVPYLCIELTLAPEGCGSRRYGPQVIEYFHSAGEGWPSHTDEVFRRCVARHGK